MMNESGIVPTMPLTPTNCNDGMFSGGGSWFWIIILFLFFFGGGGIFGGNRFGANSPDFQGYATRADINQGFQFNQMENGIRAIERGICDLGYATQQGFNTTNMNMLQGFNGVERDLCAGFNTTQREVMENRFASQQCCCETNRNIDAVRYENSRNTCDIVNAIKEDGQATRALIHANTVQDLRDRLADRDRDLMTANFQLSQQAQSANLINELRPCPVPAYPSCSPYQTFSWGQCLNGGCCVGC